MNLFLHDVIVMLRRIRCSQLMFRILGGDVLAHAKSQTSECTASENRIRDSRINSRRPIHRVNSFASTKRKLSVARVGCQMKIDTPNGLHGSARILIWMQTDSRGLSIERTYSD